MTDNQPPIDCTLHATLGRVEPCPDVECAFWSVDDDVCVLAGVRSEIVCRPALAEHLLELRATLEAA